ncbi:MAG: ABC transporter ATP-binding protein [Desulfobacteraceae bacterium]|nr:ABC transporter ATP-binding protein [Desulfobacteraceae bacterium]
MNKFKTTREKIKGSLRLDRTLAFVWKAAPGPAILSSILVVIQGVLPLASLYLIKLIIDATTAAISSPGDKNLKHIFVLTGIAAGIGIINTVCQHLSSYYKEKLSIKVSDYVYQLLHKKSVSADLEFYENPAYFDTLHRAKTEGPFRPTSVVNGFIRLIQNLVSLIAITGLLISFHWAVPLFLIGAVIPGVIIKIKYSDKMFKWQRGRTHTEREGGYLNWLITGNLHAKELRLFGLGDLFTNRFSKIRQTLRQEKLKLIKRRSIADVFAQMCSIFAMFGALGFIIFRAVNGMITLGDLVMYYQAFQRGLEFFRNLLTGLAGLYDDNLFISNFYEFIDLEDKIVSPENSVKTPKSLKHGVSFKNVCFTYPMSKKPVLSNIDFSINPGEIVALVGENGAGKSTLTKLLCRLYDPDSGSISIDKTDIKNFVVSDLRGMIGVMFQDYAQYHFSARENIWIGDIQTPFESDKIKVAAQNADAKKIIEKLPKGFETMLGKMFQNGEELSQGQWQKIALARAFMRDAQLIILDEPASSLDAESEYEIFSNFKKLLKGKSALLISHRFSTVKMADKILVLKNGSIVEQGNHDVLIEKQGQYEKWFKKQALVAGIGGEL